MSELNNGFEAAEYALEHSREVHRQAFGPILEPAFSENKQVRIILTAALNHISRREVKRGAELLMQIKEHCQYDEDKAAWTFFVGLCHEMAGDKNGALAWYADSGKFGHRFYLPYLKLAKAAHNSGEYEKARGYYETAVGCLLNMPENDKDYVLLGSAYVNLASCLIMMKKPEAAEKAWLKARECPLQPEADATAAMLYAVLGNGGEMEKHLEKLNARLPGLAMQTGEIARQILNGTHPFFKE